MSYQLVHLENIIAHFYAISIIEYNNFSDDLLICPLPYARHLTVYMPRQLLKEPEKIVDFLWMQKKISDLWFGRTEICL